MTQQQRNVEMVSILTADFMHKREAAYLWGIIPGAHLMLPRLRAFWPLGPDTDEPKIVDVSGDNHLDLNGNIDFGSYGLAPTLGFDGESTYLNQAAQNLDFAVEIDFTCGGWWYVGNASSTLMSVYLPADKGWRLYIDSGGRAGMGVSGDGTAESTVTNNTNLLGGWHFIAGRYIAGSSLSVFVDGEFSATGAPAAVNVADVGIAVGSIGDGDAKLLGRASLVWFCNRALSDAHLRTLYQLGAPLFGVNPVLTTRLAAV